MFKIIGFSVLCLIWGTTWMAIKLSLEGLPPFLGAGIRFILSAVLLGLIVLWKRIDLRLSRRWIPQDEDGEVSSNRIRPLANGPTKRYLARVTDNRHQESY